ncbi:bifunctional GNAT family N-acetyltransferase/carbon-nitrogen hydrolase family protein [Metabacillus fastidiosus]|uniref:Bifunctional GNAT family N-acetyltransferase/carbon-nitrogen hydrolase family protein n=1 Tax=Metabacillus fastidiosus TaxID=1458 RepID=A0ABU6NUL2_9BACI|nr:bifunctional GNAT family N-acetyltransferase/carbon-nitrogen hydrolase family protein [Metabacillus fastidiosus]MED4400398.1 bifunctional GNAT family N-acetyltransferase/carbon-nitrogen hydrolase family protein [Metabacillus fastidiosus]MED4454115.1 bifunctional GNAT family N-acetyltransferase/carbon-nitrogen hydrolase family protein [Metabacillus fastidiosus]MED4464282.1 bifunctional GNAT family N-acetyltransferase/carbon-nitrogen hydrolase family protein [Metabacillus fastidiosus]
MSEKLDLSKFEKKMVIRQIEERDIDDIIQLQAQCFPNMIPWKKSQLESHLDHFSEGQFCAEFEGEIIGSCSSLLINFDEYDDRHTWDDITDNGYITNHNPAGYNLYGIEVMVHPKFRRMKIGHRLYEARKDLARRLNLKSIIIGGRIPNYHKFSEEMSPRDYVNEVMLHNIYDPVLSFQLLNGFTLMRINPDYLPDDKASKKYATLMEWNNIDYQPNTKMYFKTSFPVRICVVQYMMKQINSFEEFAKQCEYYTDVASDAGSDFAVFPEIFTTQLMSFLEEKVPSQAIQKLTEYTEDYIELFTDLAVKYNINIIGGSHVVAEEGRIYNIAYLFRRDGTIEKQYKIHITPNERKWWGVSAGDTVKVFDTDCGKIAIQICYDIEFPELARIATDAGAKIIFTPFCTEDRQGYLRVRYCAQARAVENQIYTVIAGTVGNLPQTENMDVQYGQSAIFAPSDFEFARDGIVGQCNPNIEMVIIGDVDLEILRRQRQSGTVRQLKDRRKDLYSIHYKNK